MKISCNIIEDLLPLYVDDMVSEDSRQLVEEHLKACPTCRRMQEEIMRENHLTDVKKGSDSVQTNKMEAELLKKIRCKIRKKRIASVLLAVAIVLAAGGIGHYWYYDKENYISWDEANISVKDGKVYSTVNPLGKFTAKLIRTDIRQLSYPWTRKTCFTCCQKPCGPTKNIHPIQTQKMNSGICRIFRKHMNVEQIQLLMKHLFQQELNMFIM